MPPDADPIIEIKGLTHQYPGSAAGIHDLDLTIGKGAFAVLAGANGSGKTTLLRHLNGLLLPQKGTVLVEGVSVAADLKRARRKVGMIFQDADSQIVGETVYDDAAFGPENLCWPSEQIENAVTEALERVGLTHLARQSPHLLSGGEKRRLAIAGILAMRSDIIILDEPFANLDYPGVRQVLEQLVALHSRGHTLIVSTHDLEKVIAHADRLVILHQGRIVAQGNPLDVIGSVEPYGIRIPFTVRRGGLPQSWLS
jgi:biotin transport system ATP-binding protein